MSNDITFWNIIWFIIVAFAFVAYLMVMFSIIGDLFRDHKTGGFVKAIWIVALIFFPFLTALIYLIARGGGMAERQAAQYKAMKEAQDSYIREVAGASPAEQIAKAKELHNSGAITDAEYEQLKAKALS